MFIQIEKDDFQNSTSPENSIWGNLKKDLPASMVFHYQPRTTLPELRDKTGFFADSSFFFGAGLTED